MSIVVNGRFLSHRVTGVQRYAREIAARLDPQPEMICPRRMAHGIQGHLWEQTALAALVGKRLLWSPGNTGPVAVRRQVVTIHDTSFIDLPETYNWKFAAWYRWLTPRLVRRCAWLVTVSEFSRQQMARHFGADPARVAVVHNGVEGFAPALPEQIEKVRNEFSLPRDYLFYVGSLKPNKNLPRVLEAWNRLQLAKSGIELAIAGTTGAMFARNQMTETPAGVRFLGYVSDEQLPALYTGSLGFVFPSLYEGFGIPAIEAMACNAAVIASNTTSLPEVVGDAALLVDPLNVESIMDAMQRLVSDRQLREQLQQRGSERCRQFTWQRSAQQLGELLKQVDESTR